MSPRLAAFSVIISLLFTGQAQTFLPGETYYDQHQYIEYQPGTLNLIIAAPHGGYLNPDTLPDRSCFGCTYVNDGYTQELLRQIDSTFESAFNGCTPHFVFNLLDRKKLDGNRDIDEAADGNEYAEDAWLAFHDFIEHAKDSISASYGAGLFIDLHGHGHDIQRLELGYLLYEDELSLEDSLLNNSEYLSYSSIRNISLTNSNFYSHAELLKGSPAFGSLLSVNGYPSVPSEEDPFPLPGEPYFSGGYNTNRHGSRFEGSIDAIQIECNMDGVRDTYINRQAFAEALLNSYLNYMLNVYGIDVQVPSSPCNSLTVSDSQIPAFRLVQNPIQNQLQILHTGPALPVTILNYKGEVISTLTLTEGYNSFWMSIPAGLYIISSSYPENGYIKVVVE